MRIQTRIRSLGALIGTVFIASCTTPFSDTSLVSPHAVEVSPDVRAEALQSAIAVLDAPYRWAANGPDDFDCSGLIVWAYQQAYGNSQIFRGERFFQHDMAMEGFYKTGTVPIALYDLTPGDIVFITSSSTRITHGGLFVRWASATEIEFVNASSYYGTVVSDTIPINGRVRGQWFVGAGRLLVPSR